MLNTEVANGILVGTVLGSFIGMQWARVWQPALRRKVIETKKAIIQGLIRLLEEEKKDARLVQRAEGAQQMQSTTEAQPSPHGQD
ncbi:MAG: hypothetical protein QXI12_12470 [Candidatus Methanomethyliaceae archaeon]